MTKALISFDFLSICELMWASFYLLCTGWIAKGDVPEYKQFTEEPKPKRNRRHKKYGKEAREAEAIKKEMEAKSKSKTNDSLEQQILKRQSEREASANNLFDRLIEKYGGADDSEEYVLPGSKKRSKKTTAKKTSSKEPIKKVKSGRVSKKK